VLKNGKIVWSGEHPPQKSSAGEGLVTAAGTTALLAGSYALEKRLTNPNRFAQLVSNSRPTRTLDLSNLNRFQRPLAQAKFGTEHLGNFVKHAANTPAGKGALAFTAISALGFGALSAWQADRHNNQVVNTLQARNTRLEMQKALGEQGNFGTDVF
jgi:hypothetical protein